MTRTAYAALTLSAGSSTALENSAVPQKRVWIVAERSLCITFRGTILQMPRTVQARLDERAESDLALLRGEAGNDSEAIRLALREAAEHRRRRSALRMEGLRAAEDPEDLAEAQRVRDDMDAIAAPWPEA